MNAAKVLISTQVAHSTRRESLATLFNIDDFEKRSAYDHLQIVTPAVIPEGFLPCDNIKGWDMFIVPERKVAFIFKIYDGLCTYRVMEIEKYKGSNLYTLTQTANSIDGSIPCKAKFTDRIMTIVLNRIVGHSTFEDAEKIVHGCVYREPLTDALVIVKDMCYLNPNEDVKGVIYDYLWTADALKHNTNANGVCFKTRVVPEETFLKQYKLLN